MPKFHPISFNAQREAISDAIPEMLDVPEELFGFLREPMGDAAVAVEMDPGLTTRAGAATESWSMETAARSHLQTLLENQDSEHLAEITSPHRPELVPDLLVENRREQPLTGTHTVTFQQTARSIPIFGTRATVEIDGATRQLIAVDGDLADVPDIPPFPTLGPLEAAQALASFGGVDTDTITQADAPLLHFYLDDAQGESRWRLVYVFERIPVEPPHQQPAEGATANAEAEDAIEEPMYCCGAGSPFAPEYTYLIDANDGGVVLHYSASAHLDVPVPCTGLDMEGTQRTFFGLPLGNGGVHLYDPLRNISTYDHGFADISKNVSFPANPVQHTGSDFGNTAAAAVSAHFYATQVFDFFNHVLKRQSVDDKGMKLESVVNCYTSKNNNEPPPVWRNAMWSGNRMWYGQMPGGNGPLSTARFFDIIAHELSHGVTQYTASLVYLNESGALNESFSDIFGVIIKNWYPGEPNPVSGWDWSLGVGWNGPGAALRNLEDPTMGQQIWPKGRGQPAHMNQFVKTTGDAGGVHVNSGIHNRAAYNVLTAVDGGGNPLFNPRDVAILYYLTLTRLPKLATFSTCRRTLLNVATTYFSSDKNVQQEKLKAIAKAYDDVGIV